MKDSENSLLNVFDDTVNVIAIYLFFSFFFQVIFLSYCIYFTPLKYGNVEYPTYAHILGFGMSFASMFWIPSYAVYYIATERGSLKDVSEVQRSKYRHACHWFFFKSLPVCFFDDVDLTLFYFVIRKD